MKFSFALLAAAGIATGIRAAELPVIPRPASVVESAGVLALHPGSGVRFEGEMDEALLTEALAEGGLKLAKSDKAAVVFRRVKTEAGHAEAYRLEISGDGVRITGDTTGLFYGAETLARLAEAAPHANGVVSFGHVAIDDEPRYAWRGYMLDESRAFTGEKDLLRLIDLMARYKLNRLHWHLTDSPGWRIEIKKYPKLTEIGSRGSEHDQRADAPAQFYTQEQIRRIVAHAKARGVLIVPEIDMPGHADAAVRAYPEHDGGGFVQNKDKLKWKRFTFNPAKPETLAFLGDILSEVAGLFPDAKIIHIGGDEVKFGWGHWPELPEVKSLMAKEHLRDNEAVEAWFNKRIAEKVNALGFTVAGWDEIASRGLAKDKTLVFWWRHDKERILRDALDAGMQVVMCPRRPLYFDFLQSPKHRSGRTWGGICPLPDVYAFPSALKLTAAQEKHVAGVQACLWTENALTQKRREFLTWPRLAAVAEAGWTPEARKDYGSFSERLKPELAFLRSRGVEVYDPFADSPDIVDPKPGEKRDYLDKPE